MNAYRTNAKIVTDRVIEQRSWFAKKLTRLCRLYLIRKNGTFLSRHTRTRCVYCLNRYKHNELYDQHYSAHKIRWILENGRSRPFPRIPFQAPPPTQISE